MSRANDPASGIVGRWRWSGNKNCVFAIKYSGHIDEEFIIQSNVCAHPLFNL